MQKGGFTMTQISFPLFSDSDITIIQIIFDCIVNSTQKDALYNDQDALLEKVKIKVTSGNTGFDRPELELIFQTLIEGRLIYIGEILQRETAVKTEDVCIFSLNHLILKLEKELRRLGSSVVS